MAAATIEEAIYSRATTHAGLAALISTRCYHYERPEAAAHPHVVFTRISAVRFPLSGADAGICQARVQFDVYGSTAASARATGDQVRLAFERWRGTTGSVVVQDTYAENEMDLSEEPIEEREYRRMLDFMVCYNEAIA